MTRPPRAEAQLPNLPQTAALEPPEHLPSTQGVYSEMAKEFDDIDAGLQRDLQPDAPSGERPSLGPEPLRATSAPKALAGQPDAPTGQPGPPAPANTATPAPAPGLAFCENCQANVDPAGRGLCPTCGRFLPDNLVALTTGLRSKKLAKVVDAYRVDLIEQLFKEHGGRDALDVVSRIAIENYALVCAQHKTIEARLDQDGLFTQTGRRRSAFDMLKSISQTIDRLRAELPPPIALPNHDQALDAMPTSALEMASDLLKRVAAGDVLSEREQGQLDVLLAASHGKVLLPPDEPPTFDRPAPARAHLDTAPLGQEDTHATTAPKPAPAKTAVPVEPMCPSCHQSAAACEASRSASPDAWAEHHPDVIDRGDADATATMLRTMR